MSEWCKVQKSKIEDEEVLKQMFVEMGAKIRKSAVVQGYGGTQQKCDFVVTGKGSDRFEGTFSNQGKQESVSQSYGGGLGFARAEDGSLLPVADSRHWHGMTFEVFWKWLENEYLRRKGQKILGDEMGCTLVKEEEIPLSKDEVASSYFRDYQLKDEPGQQNLDRIHEMNAKIVEQTYEVPEDFMERFKNMAGGGQMEQEIHQYVKTR